MRSRRPRTPWYARRWRTALTPSRPGRRRFRSCRRAPLAAALLLLWAALAPARSAAELPLPSLRRYFDAFDRGRRPGAAVLVLREGRVLHRRGYGLADLDSREKITPRTTFDLASLSKQFTALAVAMLVERGKLGYDDPVRRHVPRLPAWAGEVTLRQLIHHTSGLPDYLDLVHKDTEAPGTNADVVELLRGQRGLLFRPGTRHRYNNTGYVLLALAIERASGRSYGAFLRSQIFAPLGMQRTYVQGQPVVAPAARGYRRGPGGLGRYGLAREATGGSAIVGDGGIHSCLDDLQRWALALQRGKLLRASTRRLALSRGRTRDGRAVNYGFGWWFERHAGREVAVHTGTWRGFKNVAAYVPDEKLWVFVLGNSGGRSPRALLRPWLGRYLRPERPGRTTGAGQPARGGR